MRRKIITFSVLFFLSLNLLYAQDRKITGRVEDAAGEPVIGASVLVTGMTNIGTITDYDGTFSLTVPESAKTLTITYIGMKPQEAAIAKHMKITLEENAQEIEEVMVVAYGSTTKGAFAGSAQAVKSETIETKNPSEISKALAGEVAGVQVVNTSGQPGTNASIRIRGIGSVNASSAPLYVVDGIPYNGDVSAIDPSDIASTTILKDATATSLYGSRGANGVILITTKKGTSGEEGKIDVDLKYGANMHLLPMYDVISSPEEYLTMSWQGLYNYSRGNGNTQDRAVNYANQNLISNIGIPTMYSIWNTDGKLLINPYAGNGSISPSMANGVGRAAGYENIESWEDAVFRVGQKAEATVKIHGGSDKTTYFTSFGYLKDEGYYESSDFNRFNVRSNLQYEPKKWFKSTLNMAYAYTTMSDPAQGDDMDNGFNYVNSIPPIYGVYERNADGTIATDPYTGGYKYDYGMHEGQGRLFGSGINPAGSLRLDKEKTTAHQVTANGSFEFKLYEGLKFTVNVGSQYVGYRANQLTNKYYGNAAGAGYVASQQVNYLSLTANQLLEYIWG